MRPHPQPALLELLAKILQASLKPRALYRDLEVLEAQLEKFVVGQRGPRKSARHGS
jgi:hypothetical protein